jgi:hypothetical protein
MAKTPASVKPDLDGSVPGAAKTGANPSSENAEARANALNSSMASVPSLGALHGGQLTIGQVSVSAKLNRQNCQQPMANTITCFAVLGPQSTVSRQPLIVTWRALDQTYRVGSLFSTLM